MTTDLLSLASRCEEADGSDETLDYDITNAVYGELPSHCAGGWNPPEFTSNLDAITALVAERLPGWSLEIHTNPPLAEMHEPRGGAWFHHGGRKASTPALAAIATILRALASQEKTDG